MTQLIAEFNSGLYWEANWRLKIGLSFELSVGLDWRLAFGGLTVGG